LRCFRATVEYDGTEFAGFQWQKDQRTVQGEIERALETLTRKSVRVVGAGRTDAGVHALGQVISFRADTGIPTERIAVAMNSVLPPDIRVRSATEADEAFHARFSARSRAYVYVILNRQAPSAIMRRFAWHLRDTLNAEAMADGAHRLIGEMDFAAWANGLSEVRTTVRRVVRCDVRRRGPWIMLYMEATGFLHGMVRNVTGTLVEVGSGKRRPEDIEAITSSGDRARGGPTAPACGLCLVRVTY
jgi:tRNA pseudouridine38-40 synthase